MGHLHLRVQAASEGASWSYCHAILATQILSSACQQSCPRPWARQNRNAEFRRPNPSTSTCRQNWTAERINRVEAMLQSFRARLAQARRPSFGQASRRRETEGSSRQELPSAVDDGAPSISGWHFTDDGPSDAGSLEMVEDLERRLDSLRDSLTGTCQPCASPDSQVPCQTLVCCHMLKQQMLHTLTSYTCTDKCM